MAIETRPSVTPQLVIGVFFTLLGVVLTLDRLHLVEARHLRPLWPLFLVAVGTALLLQRRDAIREHAVFDADAELAHPQIEELLVRPVLPFLCRQYRRLCHPSSL